MRRAGHRPALVRSADLRSALRVHVLSVFVACQPRPSTVGAPKAGHRPPLMSGPHFRPDAHHCQYTKVYQFRIVPNCTLEYLSITQKEIVR